MRMLHIIVPAIGATLLALSSTAQAEIPTPSVECVPGKHCSTDTKYIGALLKLNLNDPDIKTMHGNICVIAINDDCGMEYNLDTKIYIWTHPVVLETKTNPHPQQQ